MMFISPFIYTIYQPTNDHGTLLRAPRLQREHTRAPKRKGGIGTVLLLKYRSSDKDTRGSSIGVGRVDKTRKDLFSACDWEI